MTCIEKLKELHPDWDDEKIEYHINHYCVAERISGYILPRPGYCSAYGWEKSDPRHCVECWNSKVFVKEELNTHRRNLWLSGENMRRLDRVCDMLDWGSNKVISTALKLLEEELNTYGDSIILEVKSGE